MTFATKPELGIQMLRSAIDRGLPFAWVAADADYGKDPALRAFLHEHALPYVLGVPVTLPVAGPLGKQYQPAVAKAGDLLHYAIARDQWERRSQGEGSKGQRSCDWAWFEVVLAAQQPADGFAHHLLIRRSTEKKQLAGGRVDFEYAYFLVHHRRDAALPQVAQAAEWFTQGWSKAAIARRLRVSDPVIAEALRRHRPAPAVVQEVLPVAGPDTASEPDAPHR